MDNDIEVDLQDVVILRTYKKSYLNSVLEIDHIE